MGKLSGKTAIITVQALDSGVGLPMLLQRKAAILFLRQDVKSGFRKRQSIAGHLVQMPFIMPVMHGKKRQQ